MSDDSTRKARRALAAVRDTARVDRETEILATIHNVTEAFSERDPALQNSADAAAYERQVAEYLDVPRRAAYERQTPKFLDQVRGTPR